VYVFSSWAGDRFSQPARFRPIRAGRCKESLKISPPRRNIIGRKKIQGKIVSPGSARSSRAQQLTHASRAHSQAEMMIVAGPQTIGDLAGGV
jgi:hypothetical protein